MLPGLVALLPAELPKLERSGLHGYINASAEETPDGYGFGVSLYSAAWPLTEKPVSGFQIGLASTWILPDNRNFKDPLVPKGTVARDSMPERGPSFWTVFQTIEGGLGFWGSNRYLAPTAKFRINGTVDGYNHELSTPGWDFYGRALPAEWMGIVQLSPHMVIPPDGVTLSPGTKGELLGYAWMALPLVAPREAPVKTGNQCWTLFFNTSNFRGPVAFYLPSAWSKMSAGYAPAVGRGLDALPGFAGSGAIEINTVPKFVADSAAGDRYAKIPQLQFPADKDGKTVLIHNLTAYSKSALWNQVEGWMAGGPIPSGTFDGKGARIQKLRANPIRLDLGAQQPVSGVGSWVETAALDPYTFGLQWKPGAYSPWGKGLYRAGFPAYFRRAANGFQAVSPEAVPENAGLGAAVFPSPDLTQSYLPSDGGQGVWASPGPASPPMRAILSDGSVVTYRWYRFVDQPAMQNSGLSAAERADLQRVVEQIHRHWTPEKNYMAPPSTGKVASLDPALLVKPPKGLEVGYVPVAIRQEPSH